MNPTSQWLKGTFCPDDSSGQGKEQYISILKGTVKSYAQKQQRHL